MAAAFHSINAYIRSKPVLSYICSTHFWGPVSNFGIPVAAIIDTQKDPELISGRMTGALTVYSATFMRYALAVTPKNPLLFACHFINTGSQLVQGARYVQYWHYGGREASLKQQQTEQGLSAEVQGESSKLLGDVQAKADRVAEKGKELAGEEKTKAVEMKEKVGR